MPEYSEVERQQVATAHEKYVLPEAEVLPEDEAKANKRREKVLRDFDPDAPGAVSPLHEVKGDHDARAEHAAESHETVTNATLQQHEPYTENPQVTVTGNRAGADAPQEDTQGVEDLEMEVLVARAAESGELYTTGGPMGSYTGVESLSPYVDGTWLAERSKQTGEKYF